MKSNSNIKLLYMLVIDDYTFLKHILTKSGNNQQIFIDIYFVT